MDGGRSQAQQHQKLSKTEPEPTSPKKGLFGTAFGNNNSATSSASLPRTGSDVQAAPGSALALAREQLLKAHQDEQELVRALDRAKVGLDKLVLQRQSPQINLKLIARDVLGLVLGIQQSSKDARRRVTELQDEAMLEMKAANAKSKEAKSLEKATRKLHH